MKMPRSLLLLIAAGFAFSPAVHAWETSCYLQPAGSVQFIVGHGCPSVNPFLSIEAGYRCESCGDLGPYEDIEVTGYGDCFLANGTYCVPLLLQVTYEETDLLIEIRNKRLLLGVGCINNGISYGSTFCHCPTCESSPILISLSDEDYKLTDAAHGVRFDLDADGVAEQTAWTAASSDEAFLALDRNENGQIDNFLEIFGDHTPQLPSDEPNGWLALAVWDDALNHGNEDGIIDANDAIFGDLQLWVDENHNGFSEPNELSSLDENGVDYLDLNFGTSKRTDEFGNQFRYWSEVGVAGGARIAWDVFFVRANAIASKRGLCGGSTQPHDAAGVGALR
jgi:hypothetical protein